MQNNEDSRNTSWKSSESWDMSGGSSFTFWYGKNFAARIWRSRQRAWGPCCGSCGTVSGAPAPEKSDRQAFFDLSFNELDRGLTAEERQEWNFIYASYRGRSALTGKIIGVGPLSISVRNKQTGNVERQTMYCAVVVPYRVRIIIPASEMWESGQERPDFMLQNMVGDTVILVVQRYDAEKRQMYGKILSKW